ncbi:MAG: RsmE family RNA methyltransferase [Alphaproteobacteria bacterium]|jgi:16S rRNA (uracil1498-N3)-methyltransferase
MQNLPRIFINENLHIGKKITLSTAQLHYLKKVMRTNKCLIFNDGIEFEAHLDDKALNIIHKTEHTDPSNKIIFCFAIIKQSKMEEMLNAVTQMGVAVLQPIITKRTNERFPKWGRIEKIIIEASEQSRRNSIPKLLPPIKFDKLDKKNLIFADERLVHQNKTDINKIKNYNSVLIGPEGGFSPSEFAELDTSGAIGISLGKTILRAETAAIATLAKIIT